MSYEIVTPGLGLGSLGQLGALEFNPAALVPTQDGPPPAPPAGTRCAMGGTVGALAGVFFGSWWAAPALGLASWALGARHPWLWAVAGLVAPPVLGGLWGCAAAVRHPDYFELREKTPSPSRGAIVGTLPAPVPVPTCPLPNHIRLGDRCVPAPVS